LFVVRRGGPGETPPMSGFADSTNLDTLSSRLEVASSHATASIPIAHPDDTAGNLRERLIGETFDTVADIAVCVGGCLVGIVGIERLLAAAPDTAVDRLMDHDPPAVAPDTDQEVAAWVMLEHGEGSLAVVDNDGLFLGLIAPEKMLAVLMQEHDEDLLRFSGLLAAGSVARIASEERVARRLLHRLPWLAIGLIGAMVSAWLVGSSEEQLARTVQLAFFLPAIVYMADAVGTQTETLAVRGMSVGVPIRRFAAKEMLAGALIGCVVSALFFPFCLVVFNDVSVAVTVSLALFASCGVASAVALLLPWLLNLLDKDPAFGSGPLATVVQDLLSIAIYLALASAIVG
jgi:magnesium transporter